MSFRCAGKGDSRLPASRRNDQTLRKGWASFSRNQSSRAIGSVLRELLPLPILLPENELVESGHLRGLVQSCCEVASHETRRLARLGHRWGA